MQLLICEERNGEAATTVTVPSVRQTFAHQPAPSLSLSSPPLLTPSTERLLDGDIDLLSAVRNALSTQSAMSAIYMYQLPFDLSQAPPAGQYQLLTCHERHLQSSPRSSPAMNAIYKAVSAPRLL